VSGIDFMPYALIAGVVVASIVAVALLGVQAWVAPAFTLPLALLYLVFDRRMKRREEAGGG